MRPKRLCVLGLPTLVVSAMLFVPLPAAGAVGAAVVQVPQDHATIQAAIDAAVDGDTVLVSPGTYVELIDFLGKDITVESAGGPASTVIDGNRAGPVVTMNAAPDGTPVLRGFTVRNGNGDSGIFTQGGPALIEDNLVTGNTMCSGGVEAAFSAATIRNNVISGNRPNCSGGVGGGGVSLRGAGTVTVADNVITGNVSSSDGGGIALFAAGSPTISGNVISGNSTAGFGSGGGISHVNASNSLITNNVIVGNTSPEGGGVYWLVPSGARGPAVVNNTIADNDGAAVFADGYDVAARLANNVLVAAGADAVVECGDFNDANRPVIEHNDAFHRDSGPRYGGLCTDQTGLNGNISADPLFADPAGGDYHLTTGSPAVDAGQNAGAPATDIDGEARPVDGNGDGVPVVDLGADEFGGLDAVPPAITCAATPATLSPANHRLRSVHVGITAEDDSGTVAVTLTSATSSQPDSGAGRGDVPGDVQRWTTGTDDRDGLLRAERYGQTRVYTLTYQATDEAGNTATCQATVTVP